MQRTRVGRGVVIFVSLALLGILLIIALPQEATGQTPASSNYTVYLPHLTRGYRPGLDVPPASAARGSAFGQFSPDEAVPGQALVKWRESVDLDSISRINAQYGVQAVGMINALGVQILQVAPEGTADLIATYSSLPEVEYAEPNFIAWASPESPAGPVLSADDLKPEAASVNDPQAGQQYSLTKMSIPAAWDVSRGDGVVIAILDTGADFSHPDLLGKFVSNGRDFVNNDFDASDDHGHGTHVSGIASAATNNGVGVAGVGYNARLLPVKVLAANGSGSHAAIANGITWAADQGAKVINMSLGGPTGSSTLENAINYAWNKGVVVIVAAGNDNTSSPSYPAWYTNSIGICATDQNDQKASFSNYGGNVDVCAPGVSILSTVRGGLYQAWNGTSMAAPNAAGVAALVAAAHPTWNNAQIRQALENNADNLGNTTYFGFGRLNAARAVGSSGVPQPGPTNTPPPVYATPTRTPVVPTPTPSAPNGYVGQLIDLINQARAQNGLPALRTDTRLNDASDFHNRWMRDTGCFNHNCPNEPDVFTRMRNAGYPVISGGENIGKGYQTPQDMMNGWMNSSGHRAAILNTYWPDIGCGYLRGPSSYAWDSYWTCDFGKASDSAPPPAPTRTSVPPTPTPVQPTPIPPTPVPPTPVPPGPGQGSVAITPASNVVGWVSSFGGKGWGDNDLYSGWFANALYVSGVQFSLAALPANATITSAQLELTTETKAYLTPGSGAAWNVRWLDPNLDSYFVNSDFNTLRSLPVLTTLSPTITTDTAAAVGQKNVFVLNAAQLAALKSQRATVNRVTFRIDGPTSGPSNNVIDWDTGYATGSLGPAARPVLRITYGP